MHVSLRVVEKYLRYQRLQLPLWMLALHQCRPLDETFSSAYCNRSHIIEVREEEKIGEESRTEGK